MSVNPKFSFWFGVWTSILLLIASGSVKLTNVFPDQWIPYVTGWAMFLGDVNSVILTALHGISSNIAGPIVRKDTQ